MLYDGFATTDSGVVLPFPAKTYRAVIASIPKVRLPPPRDPYRQPGERGPPPIARLMETLPDRVRETFQSINHHALVLSPSHRVHDFYVNDPTTSVPSQIKTAANRNINLISVGTLVFGQRCFATVITYMSTTRALRVNVLDPCGNHCGEVAASFFDTVTDSLSDFIVAVPGVAAFLSGGIHSFTVAPQRSGLVAGSDEALSWCNLLGLIYAMNFEFWKNPAFPPEDLLLRLMPEHQYILPAWLRHTPTATGSAITKLVRQWAFESSGDESSDGAPPVPRDVRQWALDSIGDDPPPQNRISRPVRQWALDSSDDEG